MIRKTTNIQRSVRGVDKAHCGEIRVDVFEAQMLSVSSDGLVLEASQSAYRNEQCRA